MNQAEPIGLLYHDKIDKWVKSHNLSHDEIRKEWLLEINASKSMAIALQNIIKNAGVTWDSISGEDFTVGILLEQAKEALKQAGL